MSDDLTGIRAYISGYPGHADAAARRLSDQEVRAFVGEALVDLRERLRPTGDLADRLDSLVLHCEFGDQRALKALDDERYGEPEPAARLEAVDREIVETAARAPEITLEQLPAYLDELETLMQRRGPALRVG